MLVAEVLFIVRLLVIAATFFTPGIAYVMVGRLKRRFMLVPVFLVLVVYATLR